MSYLNANIPPIECFVRSNFLQDRPTFETGKDAFLPCVVFGVCSMESQAPLFHFLMEDGGIWWRMPIHAFAWKDCAQSDLEQLVLWDSYSSHIAVTEFSLLKNKKMQYKDRTGEVHHGHYLFTLDWSDADRNLISTFAEKPGQHKCGHVIRRDDGNFALQPNNRVLLFDPAFTTKYGKPVIQRKLATSLWTVEDRPKWLLSDDDRYDYEIKPSSSLNGVHTDPKERADWLTEKTQ